MKCGNFLLAGLFLMLGGCANNDTHLLFFTNSSLGVDISVEQSQNPVKFIVGYKRQEGVLDPLGEQFIAGPPDANGTPTKVRLVGDAHSVIAKMNFGAMGGGASDTNAAQWFATGKAAEELAKNPSTPAAISGDASMPVSAQLNFNSAQPVRGLRVLRLAYMNLDGYIKAEGKDDKEAVTAKLVVDALDGGDFKTEFTQYRMKDNKLVTDTYPAKLDGNGTERSFENVINYLEVLQASINAGSQVTSATIRDGGAAVTDQEAKAIIQSVLRYQAKLSHLQEQISKDRNVVRMLYLSMFKATPPSRVEDL